MARFLESMGGLAAPSRAPFALTLALFAVSVLVGPRAAYGQEQPNATEAQGADAERAKAYFAAGNAAYESGRYPEAAEAFENAHALAPHSAVLFNAAKAWLKVGEIERAADDYAKAVRRGELTAEQTLRSRATLARLRKKLGWITVRGSSSARVTIGYHSEVELPLTTHLAPGEHVLDVVDAQERWTQVVKVRADAPLSVVAQREGVEPEGRGESQPDGALRTRKTQKAWGFTSLGVGAALGIGAGITGAMTLQANDDFEAQNTGTDPGASQEARDQASTLKTVTNVLAFSGAAAGVIGFTLLLTLPGKSPAHDPTARKHPPATAITFGLGRMTVTGQF